MTSRKEKDWAPYALDWGKGMEYQLCLKSGTKGLELTQPSLIPTPFSSFELEAAA